MTKEHSLMQESIDHETRSRHFAAHAVRQLQRGDTWEAQVTMRLCATERHLAYEKWETAQIALEAQRECWEARITK